MTTESLEDEDEVLVALAEELGNFIPSVGAEYAYVLLPILENLANVEDSTVREKVCDGRR
jgi:serine/threonine-protein phosphatase 2A regulatory subunit A